MVEKIAQGVFKKEFSSISSACKPRERKSIFVVEAEENNEILIPEGLQIKGGIKVKGSGNSVLFGSGVRSSGIYIDVSGSGNLVTVGDDVALKGRIIVRGEGISLRVGRKTTFQSVYILCQEGCDVEIGEWCMFSRDIEIRTTDAHSVVDVKSRRRINLPGSVKIGNHVWVGVGSLISKGSVVPSDSIVGAYSFVNKKFDQENVVIAGAPAKIVREGVTWNRGRKSKFSRAQLDHWKEPPSAAE